MKKILVKAFLSLNFGDDLFLKILFDRYREVNWVLSQGDYRYKNVFKEYNNVKIKSNLEFKIKKKLGISEKNTVLSPYDAGIYIGGSIFMQLPKWKEQYNERLEIINSFYNKNKPYFILGSNFGQYKDEVFVNKYDELFKKCTDVCFRDKYSYSKFNHLENIRLAPDIVFQLKPKKVSKINNSIGVSIINLSERNDLNGLSKYKEAYYNKIKNIVELAVSENRLVTFFSFCEGQGDLIAIKEVIDMVDIKYRKKINIVNYDGDIDKFLVKFSEMENIIGTRFHACILSQVFDQGIYPIIYSEKTYNVLKDIGLDKEYTYINNILNLDKKKVLDVISSNKIIDLSIFNKAEEQFRKLDEYIKN